MKLYHGTSERRWVNIQADRWVKVAPVGLICVSTSRNPDVAKYFSIIAAKTDSSIPITISFDRETLEDAGLKLEEISENVWGEGACDWEQEVACWENIPLELVSEASYE